MTDSYQEYLQRWEKRFGEHDTAAVSLDLSPKGEMHLTLRRLSFDQYCVHCSSFHSTTLFYRTLLLLEKEVSSDE